MPHAVFWVPTAQISPTQHPTQFDGSQRPPGMHTPESVLHVVPLVQVVHCLPPTPHAALVVAITHWLPTQQPAQLSGPHVPGVWQVRSFGCASGTQTSAKGHAEQACPPFPHAVVSLPATHCPEAVQQPPQFWGPQTVAPVHAPPVPVPVGPHVWPEAQVAQVVPPAPQAETESPVRH
jgi:hypothetical protein